MILSLNYRVGDRIRYFREKAGLTQKQLGKMVGKSESAIRNYELGNRHPDRDILTWIADALKVSYYALDAGAITETFKVAHMLFEMESLFGLKSYIDEDGEVYLKFGFDIKRYREIVDKYNTQEAYENDLEPTEEEEAAIDEICEAALAPDSALYLDDALCAWALAREAKEKGLIDDQTYDDWKYKFPAFANISDDGKPEIYDENQTLVPLDEDEAFGKLPKSLFSKKGGKR